MVTNIILGVIAIVLIYATYVLKTLNDNFVRGVGAINKRLANKGFN